MLAPSDVHHLRWEEQERGEEHGLVLCGEQVRDVDACQDFLDGNEKVLLTDFKVFFDVVVDEKPAGRMTFKVSQCLALSPSQRDAVCLLRCRKISCPSQVLPFVELDS